MGNLSAHSRGSHCDRALVGAWRVAASRHRYNADQIACRGVRNSRLGTTQYARRLTCKRSLVRVQCRPPSHRIEHEMTAVDRLLALTDDEVAAEKAALDGARDARHERYREADQRERTDRYGPAKPSRTHRRVHVAAHGPRSASRAGSRARGPRQRGRPRLAPVGLIGMTCAIGTGPPGLTFCGRAFPSTGRWTSLPTPVALSAAPVARHRLGVGSSRPLAHDATRWARCRHCRQGTGTRARRVTQK